MRRGPCILLLLIVLMTLRGLVGPAMAAGMAMPHGPATGISPSAAQVLKPHSGHAEHAGHAHDGAHAVQASLAHAETAGWPACHDDDAASAPGADAAAAATGCAGDTASSHANCADCDICHTAVLVAVAAAAPPPGRQADRAPAAATRFASAGAALAIKPPIS